MKWIVKALCASFSLVSELKKRHASLRKHGVCQRFEAGMARPSGY